MKPLALITGVGPGTGASMARRFAAAGYRTALLARDAARLNALAAELPDARALPCDVTDPEARMDHSNVMARLLCTDAMRRSNVIRE